MHKLLAERLNHYVKASGLTYDELEDQSKIPRSTIYRYLKKPPHTPDPDIVAAIATATGHTKEEAYEDIDNLPTDTGEYVAEITVEETEKLKKDLESERKMQQSLADKLDQVLNVFNAESRKNEQMLKYANDHLQRTELLFDECRKNLYDERKGRIAKNILIGVLLVLATIFGMYSFYTFIAFDLPTPNKGLWPPFWLR